MSGNHRTRILSAEQIQQKWDCEKRGIAWTPPEEGAEHLTTENVKLREKVENLEEKVQKRRVSSQELKVRLDDLFNKYGVEPAEELIKMTTERGTDGKLIATFEQRKSIWIELLAYRMPKLKAIEVSGKMDHQFNIIVKKFGQLDPVEQTQIETDVANEVLRPSKDVEVEVIKEDEDADT